MAKQAKRRRTGKPAAGIAALRARVAALEVRAKAVKKAEAARRESETRYRMLAEQSSLGIVIHKGFVIRYANPALATLFGYDSPEELIGVDLRSALAPSDRSRVAEYCAARLQGEPAPPRYRCQAIHKDGTRLWVEVTASRVSWGGEAAVLGTVTDITERKRSEELTRGQTRLLKMVARGGPLPPVLEALTRMIEEHSDGMLASILLLDPDGVHLRHGAAPSLPASYTQAIDGLRIGPDVGSCGSAAYLGAPVVVSKIDTDIRWVPFRDLALSHGLRACWSTPIKSSDDRVLGTLALYYRDVREPGLWELRLIDVATQIAGIAIQRHGAEATLRDSEERYRLVFDRNLAGVFRSTRAGRVLDCNAAFARLLGHPSPEAVLAVNAREFYVDGADRERMLARLRPGETVSNHEMQWRRTDGSVVSVLLNIQEVGHGASACLEGVVIDITDRKRFENTEREAAALRSVAHLANATAHEINNPLAVIVGRLTMLDQRESGPSEREWVTKALTEAKRIQQIVHRMYEITRLEYMPGSEDLPPLLDIRRSGAKSAD
jgi:PAS domain S-box-containing protein